MMKIEITNKFRKQVDKSADRSTKKKLFVLIQQTQKANNLSDLPKLKKLKGFPHTYRFRMGDYRIGVYIQNDTIVFAAFDHRSDIYKYFP
ncbi:type II toxin-antitoxin system RelE/ParE family toxin [Prolixibacteraceae bacterium Z1-6]|uniref:Type II toxin-antitoxin system RelE/ParE family toxin n=1 Tax=Draconibacterium aestuarii TaxID=2998507 RepID=A0A9X3F213_9BACT|nr:type II toxin-antitoxin system RelE/ParE family toxin [Prolixibacteraceae bacterium Z1-6]